MELTSHQRKLASKALCIFMTQHFQLHEKALATMCASFRATLVSELRRLNNDFAIPDDLETPQE